VLPESPRWLVTHGRQAEADQVMAKIEEQVRASGQELEPIDQSKAIEIVPETRYGYLTFLRLVFHRFTRRAILGATLMITQSFLYNAIYFTYALVLINFYHVPANKVPIYGLAFAVGNLCGPLVLGPLFDSWGRKQMIAGTYIVSAVLLALSAVLFDAGVLNAATQTVTWVIIFFFASAGASAAYLTVSETWPIEIRAEAIAVFFAIGSVAGALGPAFYGALIGTGSSRTPLFWGYLIGAAIMLAGGLVEAFLGVQAAGKSLEQVTKPLTSVDERALAGPAAPAAAA
jgi:MFS family permease